MFYVCSLLFFYQPLSLKIDDYCDFFNVSTFSLIYRIYVYNTLFRQKPREKSNETKLWTINKLTSTLLYPRDAISYIF